MKLLNFTVGDDFISVIKDGNYQDLHNDFDFIRFSYDVISKEFQLNFKKRGDWVQFSSLNEINFKFIEVSFLKITEGDSIEYPNEDSCLDGIGFSTSDMRDDMKGILDSNEFKEDYDMIFTFASDYAIKIYAREVLLETN